MKLNARTLSAALAFSLLTGWPCVAAGAGGRPQGYDLAVTGGPQRTTVAFALRDWDRAVVLIGKEPYERLSLPGGVILNEAGRPAVPVVRTSLEIPALARMSLQVLDADWVELDARVAPSRGPILRSTLPDNVPYIFGREYADDSWFPAEPATLGAPYTLRDCRGVVCSLHPFQYNPVRERLRVYTRLVVEVTPGGHDGAGPGAAGRHPSRAFAGLYAHHFANEPGDGRYDPLDEWGDLLIICHDPWLPYVQPLADWKKAVGIATTLVPVSEIGADSAAIQAYIQQTYDTSNLAFVLLVGDAEHVPPWIADYEDGVASDPSYALVAGADTYPDLIVGRMSAETPEDIITQVDRTITYEAGLVPEQDWYWRGMGLASDQGPGDDGETDDEHMENIRQLLLAHSYTDVAAIYDPFATKKMTKDALNPGCSVFNHCGHGASGALGVTAFGLPDVEGIYNHHKLPFITSVACSNGDFSGRTCIGEAFLRASHEGLPTGAIGFYGGSMGQYWSEPMEAQDEFNLLVAAQTYFSYGAMCYAGSCSMMDKYGQGGVDMFLTWHIFGDPSVRVIGAWNPPGGFRVEPLTGFYPRGVPGGPLMPGARKYTLINENDAPVDFVADTDADWISVAPTAGVLLPGESTDLVVSLAAAACDLPDGTHVASFAVEPLGNPAARAERLVILRMGVPVPVHAFTLDEDPGWDRDGEWQFGKPLGLGADQYGYPDPTQGYTGPNVFGVNLAGDYSDKVGGPYWLTTDAINCLGLTQVQLRFRRWLNLDFGPYVYGMIDVSNDGVIWHRIWQNGGSELIEDNWFEKVYDLSATADHEPTVYVRWGYQVEPVAYPYSGWNLDDVEVWGVPASPPDGLGVAPEDGLAASGIHGGPFEPGSRQFILTNYEEEPLAYAVNWAAPWLSVDQPSGVIAPLAKAYVTVFVNDLAALLRNGSYADDLIFENLTDHVGDTLRPVTLEIGGLGPAYAFNLDNHPGWATAGQWAFGHPLGQGGAEFGFPDPTASCTGTNVFGVNLAGDYSLAVGGPWYLTAGPFDCTSLTQTTLQFMRWLNSDYQPYVFATLEASPDGGTWLPVWDNGEVELVAQEWTAQQYDLSAVADGQPAVYVRWGYAVKSAAYPYSGWNIDDVTLAAWLDGPGVPGDANCDGVVNVFDIDPFVAALLGQDHYGETYPYCDWLNADIDGDGHVDAFDIDALIKLLTGG